MIGRILRAVYNEGGESEKAVEEDVTD
jgi:hypothetical protein